MINNLRNHDDIIKAVSEETGYSVGTVGTVMRFFWQSFRYYIVHMEEAKLGINIKNFLVFYICEKRILRRIVRLKRFCYELSEHLMRVYKVVRYLRRRTINRVHKSRSYGKEGQTSKADKNAKYYGAPQEWAEEE